MIEPMSAEHARLTRLTIEGFRGFREAVTLDLDASAVLLWGSNGTGKTSVFDALEWLLVGDVARLREYTLRRNDEYLANIYRSELPARVEVELHVGDRLLRLRRIGNAQGSSLELDPGTEQHTVGREAERILERVLLQGDSSLAEVLATSGLLQQDDLRQLLETKPDERYRRLLRLLGLEILERFDRYAAVQRDRARADARTSREVLDRLRGEAEKLKERLETSRLQVDLTEAAKLDTAALGKTAARFADMIVLTAPPSRVEEIAALGASARTAARQIQRERAQLAALPAALPADTTSLLQRAAASRAETESDLENARSRKTTADSALRAAEATEDAVGRLAAAALPLLETDEESGPCPVCGSIIHPRDVVAELTARVASATSVVAARAVVQSAEEDVNRAQALLEQQRRDEIELQALSDGRRRVVEELRRSLAALDSLQAAGSIPAIAITAEVTSLASVSATTPAEPVGPQSDPGGQLFAAWTHLRDEQLRILERLGDALLAVADTADSAAAAASAARLAAERSAALPRQQAQLGEVQTRVVKQ